MTKIKVRLETEFETGEGNHLAAVGDVPELGAWDPARALLCSSQGNVQVVDVSIQTVPTLEFKWILLDDDHQVLRWQEGGNRKVILPPGMGHVLVQAPWDDDASIDESTGDGSCIISTMLTKISNHNSMWHWMTLAAVGIATLAVMAYSAMHI